MFDIGFWELAMIGLVALVVIGPERLPKVAYTAGKWLGKGRSILSNVKAEIDREIKAEELKQILEDQRRQMNPLHEIIEETADSVRDFKNRTESTLHDVQHGVAQASEPSAKPHEPTERNAG
jgi:sec-independent protein translocase protein TatB